HLLAGVEYYPLRSHFLSPRRRDGGEQIAGAQRGPGMISGACGSATGRRPLPVGPGLNDPAVSVSHRHVLLLVLVLEELPTSSTSTSRSTSNNSTAGLFSGSLSSPGTVVRSQICSCVSKRR